MRATFKQALFILFFFAALLPEAEGQETDPLLVVRRLISAENAGDLEEVVGAWADDALLINTRGRRIEGKSAIRAFVSANIARGIQHTLTSPTIAGDQVTWAATDETDFYRQLGVGPVNIVSRVTVRGGKVAIYVSYFPPSEIDRIEEACAAPRAAGIRLFGQNCADFVRAARDHTRAMLSAPR